MKTKYINSAALLLACIACVGLYGCRGADPGARGTKQSIEAAVSENTICEDEANLEGNHVYGYRGDAVFLKPSIQAGGYGPGDVAEIGFNIFADVADSLKTGAFYLTGSEAAGTGWAYYIPDINAPNQYISSSHGNWVFITTLNLHEGTLQVKDIEAEFYNVKFTDGVSGDSICIDNFWLKAYGLN